MRDIGVVVAVANVVRVNMENHGVLPEGLLWEGALPSAEELGEYQLQLNKLARDFARKGLGVDSAAAMVWSYSLRSLKRARPEAVGPAACGRRWSVASLTWRRR